MASNGRAQKAAECPVKPEGFSMPYDDTTKMAWFHYEYACRLYDQIESSRNNTVRRWSKRHSDEQIAEFCAYYSKRMQPGMYDIVEGRSSKLSSKVGYVRDYCHCNSKQENSELTALAQQAMSELLDECNDCPDQCLSEPGAYCEFFDRQG
jgi:hypothetical protein